MLVVATSACNNSGRTSRTGDGGTDAGITLMDSGGGGGDAGRPDTATTSDTGGSTCPPQTLPPPTEPACAAETLTCLMGCTAQACVEGCFAADPAPMACIGCTNDALIACATQNGCDDEAGNFICCASDNCASPSDTACIESMCGAELDTFNGCVMTAAGAAPCGQFSTVAVCFP
jgi:hypothetical protein